MILYLAGIILTLILITCFFNIKIGAALYIAYAILVPINDITLGPIHLGENFPKTLLILALLYDFKIRHHYKLSWRLIIPFIIYYIIELAIIPFQDETPSGFMYKTLRSSVMRDLFGAFVVYNVLAKYPRSISLIRRSLLISIFIAGLYGLYLTTTGGFNPYTNLIILSQGSALDAQFMLSYYSASDRMFGRISSVFIHPMSFGLFIGLSMIYVFAIRKKISRKILVSLMMILSLDALFCGVRSCIGGLAVAVGFYLIFSRNARIGISALIIGLIAYNIILQMPELSSYLGSIADINNSKGNVSGSSIDMRLDQLYGCFDEIKKCPFIGKGFGWTGYYRENFGDHPVILAFESLIFVILCNNGILGFFIWGLLIYLIIKNNHKAKLTDPIIADTILVFYISYSCITGEYGYMQYYLLFYVCLFFEDLSNKKKNAK